MFVGDSDLVFGVLSGFISRFVHTRLQVLTSSKLLWLPSWLVPLSSTSDSSDFMALYKLVFNSNFNLQVSVCIGQRLLFVLPWLTSRQTHTGTHTVYMKSSASWAKKYGIIAKLVSICKHIAMVNRQHVIMYAIMYSIRNCKCKYMILINAHNVRKRRIWGRYMTMTSFAIALWVSVADAML